MIEVRREDGELCGFVLQRADDWAALTVFGADLGRVSSEQDAHTLVLRMGLASLAERWELRARCEDEWRTVCIQEATPRRVRLALGYYSLPGVPTREISADELRAGEFELRLRR